jgi:nicotinate-nucleotide adenylyltransferase
MKRKGPRIGIMGGTFDPVHYGHLVTAEGARCEYGLDHVLFLPSGKPPHKLMRAPLYDDCASYLNESPL